MNSAQVGVGASQVFPYIVRLPRHGFTVDLLTFESARIEPDRLELPTGVQWSPRVFVRGTLGASKRMFMASRHARSGPRGIVHARADLAAGAALLGGRQPWVWDVRSLWRDERIQMGRMARGGAADVVLRQIETLAARHSSAIICLAEAAIPVLASRYGKAVKSKIYVLPTAVDTARFKPSRSTVGSPLRVALSGSYNSLYDGELMARFISELRELTDTEVVWFGANERSPWWSTLQPYLNDGASNIPHDQMPRFIAATDVGLAIWDSRNGELNKAAMPTKIAEFLACGRPVVVNGDLGDMGAIIERYHCGIVVDGRSQESAFRAATELLLLLDDPQLAARARKCATEVFDLDQAVHRLSGVYGSVLGE